MLVRLLAVVISAASALLAVQPGPAHAGPAAAHYAHMNPLLRLQIQEIEATSRTQPSPSVRLVLTSRTDVRDEVVNLGGTVVADIGGRLLAVRVPINKVNALRSTPGVLDLLPVQRMHPLLDKSTVDIGADRAWALRDPTGASIGGKGVLVGLLDTGIDYRNPDFHKSDGSSRIKYIWDMKHPGTPPAGFSFGTECDENSIARAQCPERDVEGHGTHVAGIAAGNGRSSTPPFIGVAPNADLIAVSSELDTDTILAGWKYMVDKAHELKEPIVINSSFGSEIGPHDGTEPESRAIDDLSGPGVVFVSSAGNEANQGMHTSGTVTQGASASITVTAHGGPADLMFAVFYPSSDKMSAELTNTATGETFGPVEYDHTLNAQQSTDGITRVSIDATPWDATHHSVLVEVSRPKNADPVTGTWRLTLTGTQVAGSARYDAWLPQGTDGLQVFSNPDESDTVAAPADAREGIAVGNYITRLSWTDVTGATHALCDVSPCPFGPAQLGDLAYYSSMGPTADGREKPDLSAPGTLIVSSLSADAPVCGSEDSYESCLLGTGIYADGKHYVASGTSMSAPHVTGTVALMLQIDPSLQPDQIDTILRRTARHDTFTGSGAWTPGFGAGKLNALAAVQEVLVSAPATATPLPRTPTSTPPPSFSYDITGVGLEARGGSIIQQAHRNQPVYIRMTVRFRNVRSIRKTVIEWRIGHAGQTVGYHIETHPVAAKREATYRWRWKFTPRMLGAHTATAAVTVGSATKQKSLTFTVGK